MIDKNILENLIRESIAKILDEAGFKDRIAAATAGTAGKVDKVNLNKLIFALSVMKKRGTEEVSMGELQALAKQNLGVSAPLGHGGPNASQDLVNRATSKTGGQPVLPPSMPMMNPREGTIRMSEADLKEMVGRAVAKKIFENFGQSNPIMAKREIIALMDQTSRSFEREIIKTFDLQDPDMLPRNLQGAYLQIVEGMKMQLIKAAMDAVEKLIKFPKQSEGNGDLKAGK